MSKALPVRRMRALAALLSSACLCATTRVAEPAAAEPPKMSQAQSVHVNAAWLRWLPGGVPLAGYATLGNDSNQEVVLTSVSSSAFQDVSLHQTLQSGGSVRMIPIDRLPMAPHVTLDFAARGIHLMLMQPRKAVDPRGSVTLMLHFADGSALPVPFAVRGPADPAPRD